MNVVLSMIKSLVIAFAVTLSVMAQVPTVTPVDEFGKHSTEDLMARLDNLSTQLYNNEGSTALIRIYAGKEYNPGYPSRYLAIMKTYLTNHKVPENRISIQNCDSDHDTQYRLYIVRAGAKIPDCQRSLFAPQTTKLFDSYFYSYEYPDIEGCCNIPGADAKGALASLKAFAELLDKSPESQAYVIAYNGTNKWWYNNQTLRPLDPQRKATATAIYAKNILIRNGINAKRIKAINGGYRDSLRNVELWFVPKGHSPPKATPNYFPKTKSRRK